MRLHRVSLWSLVAVGTVAGCAGLLDADFDKATLATGGVAGGPSGGASGITGTGGASGKDASATDAAGAGGDDAGGASGGDAGSASGGDAGDEAGTDAAVCEAGTSAPCYSGPAGTSGVGTCKPGNAFCDPTGQYGVCAGEVVPAPEHCGSAEDEDCDGSGKCTTHAWSLRAGDGSDELVESVAIGAGGDVFVLTSFGSSIDFGDGVVTSNGAGDMLLSRFDASGTHVKSQHFGGSANDVPKDLVIDGSGNIVLAGDYKDAAGPDFGGGALPVDTSSNVNIFVAKLSPTGGHVWSKAFGDSNDGEVVGSIAAGPNDRLALAGAAHGGTIDFGGGVVGGAGAFDAYIAVLDASGNHVWSTGFGDSSDQLAWEIAFDPTGAVVVVGNFQGAFSVDASHQLSAPPGAVRTFVLKLDATGKVLWLRDLGPTAAWTGYGLALDPVTHDAIVTGCFVETANMGGSTPLQSAGGRDLFLARLASADGSTVWAKRYGDSADWQYGLDVAVDASGKIALTGAFRGSIDFGGGALTSLGERDVLVAKLDDSAGHVWSGSFGSLLEDVGSSVAVDATGAVVIGGRFTGGIDFGGGLLNGQGMRDAFVAKLAP